LALPVLAVFCLGSVIVGSLFFTQRSVAQTSNQPVSPYIYNQFQPLPTGQPLNLGSVAAILSYAGGWFTGLLFFLFAGQNRYVRFHALQSLIFFGSISLLDIALINLGMFGHHHFHYITVIAFLAFFLLNIVAFFGWLIAMIQAARGRYYKLPFVGAFVEQCLNRHVIVK
jgi:uncharacterized membrane protein